MSAPTGAVLAINGPWGAGKSSAINLIEHHLKASVERGDVVLVPFNPWWFAGADALILAFFRELGKAIEPSLPSKFRKSITSLGQSISALGTVAAAVADMKVPGIGAIVSGAAGLIGKAAASDKTVEEEHRVVSEALANQNKRFVVVIDDIDRLSPDDVLTIFRLIKSVGRLPNVIYLLAFDRQIAERIVAERFPSEGASYLDKIIQGSFELPPPRLDFLRWHCAEIAMKIMGEPDEAKKTRFWNVFYDIVGPTICTPRDVTRIGNHLATTWVAVAGNVDRADFLGITALQLSEPVIYAGIRQNPDLLCGIEPMNFQRQENRSEEYDALFGLGARPERERKRLRTGLKRLFPRLDAIWDNTFHQGETLARDRRVASEKHFRSYFTFSVSDDVFPAGQLDIFIDRADDPAFVVDAFRMALGAKRATGETQIPLLLDELSAHASEIPDAKIPQLVATLFSIADSFNVKGDAKQGFGGFGGNSVRLHWFLNRLVHDRLPIEQREAIYRSALAAGSLGWTVDFVHRCLSYFTPRDDGKDRGEPIVGEAVAQEFKKLALARLKEAAVDGSLVSNSDMVSLLWDWKRLSGTNGAQEVRAWTDSALTKPEFLMALAEQLPSSSWSFGMGDRVQRQTVKVDTKAYENLIDIPRLYALVDEELSASRLPPEELEKLRNFKDIPRGSHGDRGFVD